MTDSEWDTEPDDATASPPSFRVQTNTINHQELTSNHIERTSDHQEHTSDHQEPTSNHQKPPDSRDAGSPETPRYQAGDSPPYRNRGSNNAHRQPRPKQRRSGATPPPSHAAMTDPESGIYVHARADNAGGSRPREMRHHHQSEGGLPVAGVYQSPQAVHSARGAPAVAPRPRSAQALPPPDPGARMRSPRQAASQDNFWRTMRTTRDVALPPQQQSDYQNMVLNRLAEQDYREVMLQGQEAVASPRYHLPSDAREMRSKHSPHDSGSDLEELASLVEEPPSDRNALTVALCEYEFPRGEARSLATTDRNPSVLLRRYGRRTQRGLMRAWAEAFWVLSIPLLTISTFLQTLLRWTLQTVALPLIIAPVQLIGDYLVKPGLVTLHDAVVLPALTLTANGASALLLVARPLAELVTMLVSPLAMLLASLRLVQVNYSTPRAGKQLHVV